MVGLKKKLSLLFKLLIVFIASYGILLNSGYPNSFEPQMFLYYTILSNLICLIYFVVVLCQMIHGIISSNEFIENMRVKGAVIMVITVTMTIYWLVLVPAGFVMGEGSTMWANLIVHLIVPLLVIFDWLLFNRKGGISKNDPVYWIIIPLCYYLFTVMGYFLNVTYVDGSHYPYFFIDSELLGWGTVGLNVFFLVIVFLVIGYLVYFTDNMLKRMLLKIEE